MEVTFTPYNYSILTVERNCELGSREPWKTEKNGGMGQGGLLAGGWGWGGEKLNPFHARPTEEMTWRGDEVGSRPNSPLQMQEVTAAKSRRLTPAFYMIL